MITPLPTLTTARMRERLQQIHRKNYGVRPLEASHAGRTSEESDAVVNRFIDYCEQSAPNTILDDHEIECALLDWFQSIVCEKAEAEA